MSIEGPSRWPGGSGAACEWQRKISTSPPSKLPPSFQNKSMNWKWKQPKEYPQLVPSAPICSENNNQPINRRSSISGERSLASTKSSPSSSRNSRTSWSCSTNAESQKKITRAATSPILHKIMASRMLLNRRRPSMAFKLSKRKKPKGPSWAAPIPSKRIVDSLIPRILLKFRRNSKGSFHKDPASSMNQNPNSYKVRQNSGMKSNVAKRSGSVRVNSRNCSNLKYLGDKIHNKKKPSRNRFLQLNGNPCRSVSREPKICQQNRSGRATNLSISWDR